MTQHWPLPRDLTAAHTAREHVAQHLQASGVSDEEVIHDACLVVSELVANAVRHGQPPIDLRVDHVPDRIRITVGNHGSTGDPRITVAPEHAHHGRGLAIVEALSEQLGWVRHGDRLEVWAEITMPGVSGDA